MVMGEFFAFLIQVLLILVVLLVVFGVVLLFTKDESRMAGYKSVVKFCLGTLCSILCILWLIQLFWGGGWRIMHVLFFLVSASIAIGCFVSLRRNKSKLRTK